MDRGRFVGMPTEAETSLHVKILMYTLTEHWNSFSFNGEAVSRVPNDDTVVVSAF